MELLDGTHEGADTHAVRPGWRRGHEFLGAVVHRVELSDLVAEPDALEKGSDVLAGPGYLEIVLGDTKLGEGRREQKVHGLGLITVVLKFSYR